MSDGESLIVGERDALGEREMNHEQGRGKSLEIDGESKRL